MSDYWKFKRLRMMNEDRGLRIAVALTELGPDGIGKLLVSRYERRHRKVKAALRQKAERAAEQRKEERAHLARERARERALERLAGQPVNQRRPSIWAKRPKMVNNPKGGVFRRNQPA